MKFIISVLALCTAIAAIVFTAAENADGAGRRTAPRGTVQAKIEYCTDCHGLSGQGYHGYLTIEAFGRALPALAAATKVWRDLFPDPLGLCRQGLAHIRSHL